MISKFCHNFFFSNSYQKLPRVSGSRALFIRTQSLSYVPGKGSARPVLWSWLCRLESLHSSAEHRREAPQSRPNGRGGSVAQPREQLRGEMRVVSRMDAECIIRQGPIPLLPWKSTMIGVGSSCVSMHVLCSQVLSWDYDESPCLKFNLSMFTNCACRCRCRCRETQVTDRDPTIGQTEPPLTRSCSLSPRDPFASIPRWPWRLRGH
jgi:hypothetical protein